jgi:hypothetical protein
MLHWLALLTSASCHSGRAAVSLSPPCPPRTSMLTIPSPVEPVLMWPCCIPGQPIFLPYVSLDKRAPPINPVASPVLLQPRSRLRRAVALLPQPPAGLGPLSGWRAAPLPAQDNERTGVDNILSHIADEYPCSAVRTRLTPVQSQHFTFMIIAHKSGSNVRSTPGKEKAAWQKQQAHLHPKEMCTRKRCANAGAARRQNV